jgi:hypothetical protein
MKKILITIIILLSLYPLIVFAHPGNTASDGCHYCRTNCDKWGETWNKRHCHDEGSDFPIGWIILIGIGGGYIFWKYKNK